ncbi:GerMN domain-containing protein [Mycobacterium kansasii]|uniref:GerMN domain-containing protein n=1 Tax=Mycobacterium kansasii TaxID=1768 RepID=UPI0018DBEBB4|nr:Gmad2 immunoglobulin-like domain-containing protein [Mycobacterium kansasii]
MRRALCLISAIGWLYAGAACATHQPPAATTSSKSGATSTAPTTMPGTGVALRVYFVRAGKVATAGRNAADPHSSMAAELAVRALLAGAGDFERGIGLSTEIPAATKLLGLNVAGGTATVDLSNDFRADGAALSAVPMQLRVAEVVCTLTQFAGVDQVTITVDGKPLDGAANLKRADVDAVLPRILIESPVPGEAVTSPLKVSGIANVFEGTVTYSVNAPDGAELDQGFTTVTGLEWGNWGPFAFTSNYSTQQHGLGRVTVWEVSMKDGSHRNVYEVPVNF